MNSNDKTQIILIIAILAISFSLDRLYHKYDLIDARLTNVEMAK